MTDSFKSELISSGYIHKLLNPNPANSSEARLLKKQAVKSRAIWDNKDISVWSISGAGKMEYTCGTLLFSAPSWVAAEEAMPHYAAYAYTKTAILFAGEDWRSFNRIRLNIKPVCCGYHAPFLTLTLENDGEVKVPDAYDRLGYHVINLKNNDWNECVWEFSDLPRDKITEFALNISCHGKEPGGAEHYVYYIKDIYLEEVEKPDRTLGWVCDEGMICYSTSGYFLKGEKKAVTALTKGQFCLIGEDDKEVVYEGKIKKISNAMGKFGVIDFSDFKSSGRYHLRAGDIETQSFRISENPFDDAVWKAINFVYAERCGFPVNGGHAFCHGDFIAEHEGQKKVYCGGWHDAGDLSQQTLQTGEVVHALYEMAEKVKDDTLLYNRLMEEAGWGLDFLIRTRFANGYRATSVGCMRFTDQIIGNADDEPVRVGNRSFDNFVMGAIEAASALRLQEYDLDKSFIAIKAAREDFDYAHRRFMSVGIEEGMDKEHTYNAGLSQYYAAAAWCGGQIYKVSGELYYAFEAAKYGKKLLACQDIGNADLAFDGFFYRDMDKEVITHFNHQGRDHLYTLALVTLCEIEKDNYQRKTWEYALKRYGAYLKTMRKFASPYGMQPSGVHAYNEALDAETFRFMHFYTDYETDKDNYQAQLAAGIKLNDKFCIRQFPIWFSFRGNSAVILSAGKAAAMIGRYFGDEKLLDIARDQLYWNAGKNPFAQSLMYGEGANYAQQYASLLGETVGEMPVGIQTRENEDVPFYPSANYCTYKEVWMSVIGRWLYVLADIL